LVEEGHYDVAGDERAEQDRCPVMERDQDVIGSRKVRAPRGNANRTVGRRDSGMASMQA
jgi:hypothetical protein